MNQKSISGFNRKQVVIFSVITFFVTIQLQKY